MGIIIRTIVLETIHKRKYSIIYASACRRRTEYQRVNNFPPAVSRLRYSRAVATEVTARGQGRGAAATF